MKTSFEKFMASSAVQVENTNKININMRLHGYKVELADVNSLLSDVKTLISPLASTTKNYADFAAKSNLALNEGKKLFDQAFNKNREIDKFIADTTKAAKALGISINDVPNVRELINFQEDLQKAQREFIAAKDKFAK
jgi:hypothetical protein